MEETDIELMLRVSQDDANAFNLLANRYRAPLRRFLASLLQDQTRAEDGVQETLLRLWLHRKSYEPTGRFSSYLFQIARHYAWNQQKKYRREIIGGFPDGQELAIPAPRANQPDAIFLERIRMERIRAAVRALPPHYRVVFELNQAEGLRYAAIADRLDIPLGTVKSRMSEALRRLRLSLSEPEGE
jgi:RNA polymerase sigma-70 factor, ECF subfamily